jgi:hypothetical protein
LLSFSYAACYRYAEDMLRMKNAEEADALRLRHRDAAAVAALLGWKGGVDNPGGQVGAVNAAAASKVGVGRPCEGCCSFSHFLKHVC